MISSNMNGLLLAHTAEKVRVFEVLSPASHERDYRCSASFPGSDGLKNVDGNTHAGMDGVIHVVTTALVDNVNVVRVVPTVRPGIKESERIAAIAETVMIVVASVDVKIVSTAKTGAIVLVRNTAMTSTGAFSIST